MSASLLAPAIAAAATLGAPVRLDPALDEIPLLPHLSHLEDPAGALTIDQLRAQSARAKPPSASSLGYTTSAHWLSFELEGGEGPGGWFLVFPLSGAEECTIYEGPDEETARACSVTLPLEARELPIRRVAFRVALAPGERRVYHVRLATEDTLDLGLVLRTERRLLSALARENLALGCYYGIIAVMILYNLFLSLSLRDILYLHYVLFQTAFALAQTTIDQTARFVIEDPALFSRASIVLGAAAVGAGLTFSRRFLRSSEETPRFDRMLQALVVAAGALSAAGLFSSARALRETTMIVLAAGSLTALGAGIAVHRRGYANARFFLLGWGVFLGGCVIDVASSLTLLPRLADWLSPLKLGSAFEATALSLGLAHRVKELRDRKAIAESELLRARTLHAARLEATVEERTRELWSALAELGEAQAKMLHQAKLAALGELVAGIAHEIGNPLNFSMGGARDVERKLDAIERDAQHPAAHDRSLRAARRSLRLVIEGGSRIERLLRNLRTYVRSGDIAPEPTDICEGLEASLALAEPQLASRSISVIRDLEPLPLADVRPGEINQVFTNLIVNAGQAMPDGGALTVRSRARGDRIEITFADTGPGVAPEIRGSIFNPFFTTRAPGEGVGLGLSIASEIVRRHGGTLALLDSDRGASFRIVLPIQGSGGAEPRRQ